MQTVGRDCTGRVSDAQPDGDYSQAHVEVIGPISIIFVVVRKVVGEYRSFQSKRERRTELVLLVDNREIPAGEPAELYEISSVH